MRLLTQRYAAFFFFFDWSEWFPPAAHLRKTDDNAVGVIYSDFTKMNMRSAFSSCKCACAQKPPSFGYNYFCCVFFPSPKGDRLAITDWKQSSLVNVNPQPHYWLLLLFVCGIKLHLIWYWALRGPCWGLRWHCSLAVIDRYISWLLDGLRCHIASSFNVSAFPFLYIATLFFLLPSSLSLSSNSPSFPPPIAPPGHV